MKTILMDDGMCWYDKLEQESFRTSFTSGMWWQESHTIDKRGNQKS
jgi:hypothetical protein